MDIKEFNNELDKNVKLLAEFFTMNNFDIPDSMTCVAKYEIYVCLASTMTLEKFKELQELKLKAFESAKRKMNNG